MQKIIIDTDAGHDDVLAMMMLIKSQQFDVMAITTVAGNSSIEKTTRNAQAILNLLSADIPLYSGPDSPLTRELITAVVHGDSGLDGMDVENTDYSLTYDASDQIKNIIDQNPGEVTILTLGPLTNIANLLTLNPGIDKKIKELVIMGGAINVAGNKNRVAEFNMFVDPEAADIVFKSGVKKVVVPLDPCNDILLRIDLFEQLKGSKLYEPVMSMMKHFMAGIKTEEGVDGLLVYDALAAYYLLNPQAFELKGMDIIIETTGTYTAGMTVTERRLTKPINVNAEVVTNIDRVAFEKDLIATLQ